MYRELLQGLYDAILVTDARGFLVDNNTRAVEFFQYGAGDLWNMSIATLISKVTPHVLERIRRGLADERFVVLDAQGVRKDGTTFPAEVAISTIHRTNEQEMVFSVRNIERRKNAQQRLHGDHNAMMHSLAGAVVCGTDGRIESSNPAFNRMWGFAGGDEAVGRNLGELWQDAAAARPMIEKPLAGEDWSGTMRALTVKGVAFSAHAATAPNRDYRDRIIGLVGSFSVRVAP